MATDLYETVQITPPLHNKHYLWKDKEEKMLHVVLTVKLSDTNLCFGAVYEWNQVDLKNVIILLYSTGIPSPCDFVPLHRSMFFEMLLS